MTRHQARAQAKQTSLNDDKLTRTALAVMAVGMIIGALLTL
jgi:hypothetical protein